MLISVIICTHNPRILPLQRTLESLRAQSLHTTNWELLIIDNASQTKLSEIANTSWQPNSRYFREDELGLTPARLRGIAESRADLLLFVDDDNVLAPDYLETLARIASDYRFLGAFGSGALVPEFEESPCPKAAHLLPMLALRSVAKPLWTNAAEFSEIRPWGAGLCVRRSVAETYRRLAADMKATGVLDRRGAHLFSGGDDLFSWAAARTDLGFGIFPDLRITHLIAAERVKPPYLLRLIRDHKFSHSVLNYLLQGEWPGELRVITYARLAAHGVRRGLFSMRCQWASATGERNALNYLSAANLKPLNFISSSLQSPPRSTRHEI